MIASLTTFTTLGTVIYLIVRFDGGGVLLNVLTTDIPTSVTTSLAIFLLDICCPLLMAFLDQWTQSIAVAVLTRLVHLLVFRDHVVQ